jgi:acyl-coenzyme A synthetase/AMP-(fatty) acid ligase
MNFARDVVERQPAAALALVELARDGSRREWSYGEVADYSARLAGALAARGIGRGDVVMTLIGNRPEWVFTMVACMRIGAVVLPCTEQLRAKDLRLRIAAAEPSLIVADERNRSELEAARPECAVALVPDGSLFEHEPAPAAALAESEPCLITFTSGTAGGPKAVVHAQRYLPGQRLQAEHWLGAREGELVWCTAASGWSKSARNVFIAPWLCGASALLHDARFDAAERVALLAQERVNVLCMAPTEYRVIAKRGVAPAADRLHSLLAAGEALNPEVLQAWRAMTGLDIRDGYGQTETGQLTGAPPGTPARPGSMGTPLPGVDLGVDRGGELVVDPQTVPTFFLGYLGEQVHRRAGGRWDVHDRRRDGPWHTGDLVSRDDEGWLHFQGRNDDVIVSAGYRIGPFEVESALVSHPAVLEAAAVAAPDEERGAVVRAVVVLRGGNSASDELARALQEHVKRETAPYKYPRIVQFVDELPKTASGKVRRAALRDGR